MKKYLFMSIAIATIYLSGITFVHANSMANVEVWVDWSTFEVTVGGSAPNYVDRGSYSQANAGYSDSMGSPNDEWSPRTATFWGASEALKTVGNATGHTWTTENGIFTDTSALADGVANTYGRASSWVYRIGYFTVSADSELNASVTFNLQRYFDYDTSFETAGGYNYLGMGLSRINPLTGITETITGDKSEYWYNSNTEELNGFASSTETLNFTHSVLGGYTYAVDVAINSDANCGTRGTNSVPEPTTMLLYGLGFVGAGVYRRLRKDGGAKVKR